ncbi:MAG: S-layer homology domain-containing protein [Solirubrobacterales bacterium]
MIRRPKKPFVVLLALFLLAAIFPVMPETAVAEGPVYYGSTGTNDLYRSLVQSDVNNHWSKQPVYHMAALGVIRGVNGKFLPNAKVSKEQALAMITGFMGKNADAAALAEKNPLLAPPTNRSVWSEGYLLYAQSLGLLTEQQRWVDNWKANATREDVAYWIGKALAYTPVFGHEMQSVPSFTDSGQFTPERAPYCEPVIADRIMSGRTASQFAPKGTITRGEICSVLDRAAVGYLTQKRGFKTDSGTVVYVDSAGVVTAGGVPGNNRTVYHLIGDNENQFSMIKEYVNGVPRDFLVIKDGSPRKGDQLAVGDNVELMLSDKGQIIWAGVEGYSPSAMFVTLENVDLANKTLGVRTPANARMNIPYLPTTTISLDGYPGKIEDLIGGQTLTLKMTNNKITGIDGSSGYIYSTADYKPVKTVFGTLLSRTAIQLELRDDTNTIRTITYTANTQFVRQSRTVQWSDLQAGDYMKLYLDGANSDKAYRVEVTSMRNAVTGVYKARLQSVDVSNNRLQLYEVRKYSHGDWQAPTSFTSLPVAVGAELYDNGKMITLEELKNSYKEGEMYLATSSSYGTETVTKLNYKTDAERKYSGKIVGINPNLNSMSVEQVPTEVKTDNGTIILKDNKLGTINSLSANEQGVFFTNDDGTAREARFISVETVNVPTLTIYRGRFNKVRQEFFVIDSYAVMTNNQFDSDRTSSSESTFYMTNETGYLNGMVSNNVYSLTRSEFTNNGMTGSYNTAETYVVSDGTNAIAANITKRVYADITTREYTGERVSAGTVMTVGGGTATITALKDWEGFQNQWSLQSSSATLNLKSAVIIKDKKPIALADLKAGDSVYILRSGMFGLVVIVQ